MVMMALLSSFLFFGQNANAQLQVTSCSQLGWTPQQLVDSVLTGGGVNVSNVTFNGNSGAISCDAIGRFTTGATPTNLGIGAGIIISTGNVADAVGPDSGVDDPVSSATGCSAYSDAQMSGIANGVLYDCSVLEFDFTPRSDTVQFRFVFASEEYPSFVGSSFSDVFGFFLSSNEGGDPLQYSNTNIAVVPNSTLPIGIQTINGGTRYAWGASTCVLTNTQYYVDNAGGSSIEFNGFTTVLTAKAHVTPCRSYHIKIGITNVSDDYNNSAVFLEAGSLTSFQLKQPSVHNYANAGNPTHVYESCCAHIVMRLTDPNSPLRTLDVTTSGTATAGQDYTLESSYTFPAGCDSLVIPFCPVLDGASEGLESVVLHYSLHGSCPGIDADSMTIWIENVNPMAVSTQRTENRGNNTVTLTASFSGGLSQRAINWYDPYTTLTSQHGTSVTLPLQPPRKIAVCAHDSCHNEVCDTIVVGAFECLFNAGSDGAICAGEPYTMSVSCADSCVWYANSQSSTPIETRSTTLTVTPTTTTQYIVRSYRQYLGRWFEGTAVVTVTVHPIPHITVQSTPGVDANNICHVCNDDSVHMSFSGADTYKYSVDNGLTWSDWSSSVTRDFMPPQAPNYASAAQSLITVIGHTSDHVCGDTASIYIATYKRPQVSATVNANDVCPNSTVTVTADGSHGMWGAWFFDWNGDTTTTVPRSGANAYRDSYQVTLGDSSIDFVVSAMNRNRVCPGSDTVHITIHNPEFELRATPMQLCKGDSIRLTVLSDSTLEYRLLPSSTWATEPTTFMRTMNTAGNITVTVYGRTVGTTCIDTQSVEITVWEIPTPTVNPDSIALCDGENVTLTGTGYSNLSYYYRWRNANGTWANNYSLSPNYNTPTLRTTGTSITTYKYILYSWDRDQHCYGIDSAKVYVHPIPDIQITAPQWACDSSTITISATGAHTYSLDSEDGPYTAVNVWNRQLTGTTTFVVYGRDEYGLCTGIDSVTVNAIELPDVTINDEPFHSTISICEHESEHLTAAGATRYEWGDGGITNAVRDVSPITTTNYNVTGFITSHGIECQQEADVTVVVVIPSPVSIAANRTAICNGESITLTASNRDNLPTIQYSWFNDSTYGSTTTQTVTPQNHATVGSCTDTVYNYFVFAQNPDGTCVNSDTVQVTVHQLPAATLTPDHTEICSGGNVNFTYSAQGCTPFTYSFNNTNSYSTTASGTVSNLTGPATNTYILYAKDHNNCVNTDTTTVSVYTYPTNLQLRVNTANVCSGDQVTFTATGARIYSWDGGNTYGTTGTYNLVVTRDTTFTVYGANEDPLCYRTAQVTVHVYEAPELHSTVSAPVICRGSSTTITVSGSDRYKFGTNGTYGTTNSWTVTPQRDTTYTIFGTPQGAQCPSNVAVSIRVKALPVLALTASPDSLCLGSTTTLTATGANLYSFTGSAPYRSNNTYTPTAPATAGTQQYTVTGQDTTLGVTCSNTATTSITVLSYPSIQITPSASSFCLDSCVVLTASGAARYSWGDNTHYQANNSQKRDCPTSTSNYIVYGTLANGMCESSSNITITVFQPTALTVSANQSSYGENDQAILTANASGCQFSWQGGTYSASNTYTTEPLSEGDHTYTVCARNNNGCVSCTTITVRAYAIAEATLRASDTSICRGEQVTFYASGARYYSWNRGTNYGTSSRFTVTPTQDTTVILFGCDDPAHPEYYTTDTVFVRVTPIPVFTLTPDTTTICRNQQVTLTTTPARSDYEYSFDGNAYSTATTYTITPQASQRVTVICHSAVNNRCSSSKTARIGVLNLPTVTLTTNHADICNGDTVTLTAGGATRYSWNGGAMETSNTKRFRPTTTTTYTVEGEVPGGAVCSATASVIVTVHQYPTMQVSPDTAICIGDTAHMRASGADLYSWNGGLSGTTSTYDIRPQHNFSVTIIGTDASGMCPVTVRRNIIVNQLPSILLQCPGTAGINRTVTLTARGGASYSWDDGETFVSSNTNTTTYGIVGSHEFCVIGRDNNQCKNRACCTTQFIDMPSSVTMSTLHDTVCRGDADSVYVSGALYYQWSYDGTHFIPAVPSSSQTAIGLTVTQDTTIYVRGFNQTANLAFYSQESIRIGVKDYPVLSVSSDAANNTICYGQRVNIQLSGADLYKFDRFPENTISRYPQQPTSTTRYPVQARFRNSSCITYDTITITVNPLPNVSMTITPDSMCVGDTVQLQATSPTAVSYSWNDGLSGAQRPASPATTTAYTVTATDGNGCTRTATRTLRVLQYHPVTLESNLTAFCHDSTITLTATSDAGAYYRWMDDTMGLVTYNTVTRTPENSRNYTVQTANSNGMCVSEATVHVTVYPLPYVRAQANTTNICIGDRVHLTATGDARWFSWSDTNHYVARRVALDTVPTGNTGHWAYFTLYGKSEHNCLNSFTDSVWVNSIPTIRIDGDTNACQGDLTLFVASGAMQYSWGNRTHFAGTPDSLFITDSVIKPIYSDTTLVCYGANESSRCYSSASIHVNMFTYASLQARATATEICEGDSVCINLSGALSYSYNDEDRAHFNNVTQYCFRNLTDTTSYRFYGLAENGRCVSAATVTVNVTRLPRLYIATSVSDACVGDVFSARLSGADQYSWNGGLYRSNPLYYDTVTASRNTYYVGGRRLTNAGYCYSHDSVTIRRWTYPELHFTSNDDTICSGDSIVLSVSETSGITAYYQWHGDTAYSTVTRHDTALTRSGYMPITAINYADSLFMCAIRDSIYIHVNELPHVHIRQGHMLSICKYEEFELNAQGAGTGGEYSWGDTNDYSTIHNSLIDMPPATRTYIVYGRDVNYCVNWDTCRVTVYNYPTNFYLTSSRIDICRGDTVQIFANGARFFTADVNTPWLTSDTSYITTLDTTTNIMMYGATDSTMCYDSASLIIRVHEYPNTEAYTDRSIYCSGDTAIITVSGATEYSIDGTTFTTGGVFHVAVFQDTDIVAYGRDNIGLCVKPDTVHVRVQQLPTLTLSASPDSICVGSTATLTATGADTYSWNNRRSYDAEATHVVRPDSTTIYTVYGEKQFAEISCRNSASVEVAVFEYPNVSIFTEAAARCQYDAIRFIYRGNADSISWNNGATYTARDAQSEGDTVYLAPDSTGWMYVYGKYAGGICPAKDSVYLTIYPAPLTTATPSSDTVCAGDTVILTLTGAEYYSVAGDAFGYNTTHILRPDSTTQYVIVGENFSDGYRCRTNDTIVITVMPYPTLRLSVDTTEICFGESVTFTAESADRLSWEGGAWTSGQRFTTTMQPPSTHIYTIAGANANGMCVTKDSIKITVHQLPVMVLHPDRPHICRGDQLRLTVEDSTCIEYSWDGGVTYTANYYHDTMPRRGYSATFTAYGRDVFGCTNHADTVVTISDVPQVRLVASDTAICVGSSIILTVSGAELYSWDGGLTYTTDNRRTETPAHDTVYTVYGASSNLMCKSKAAVRISVYEYSYANIVAPNKFCQGDTVELYVNTNGTRVEWSSDPGDRNLNRQAQNRTIRLKFNETTTYCVESYLHICTTKVCHTVVMVPYPELHIEASTHELCVGGTMPDGNVVAPGTVTIEASGANLYSWDGGDTQVSDTSHTYTPTLPSPTEFNPDSNFVYWIYSYSDDTLCRTADSVHVRVDQWPELTICDGQNYQGIDCDSSCVGRGRYLDGETFAPVTWTAVPSDATLIGQEHSYHPFVDPHNQTDYTVTTVNGTCFNSYTYSIMTGVLPSSFGICDPAQIRRGTNGVTYRNLSTNALGVMWYFPDGYFSKAIDRINYVIPVDAVDSFPVTLIAYNGGCFDTSVIRVDIVNDEVWAPNVFTPDEAVNNIFYVRSLHNTNFHMDIYSRNGVLVFSTDDPEQGWDGKHNGHKCPQGTYVYVIKTEPDNHTGKDQYVKGTVTLLR